MDDFNDNTSLHREFLRGLSVQLGQVISHVRGGHPQPSPEVMEKEIEDVLKHYISMEQSGIYGIINSTAFMMSRFIDPYGRNSMTYTLYLTQVFMSFMMSNLRILIDKDLITLVDPPEIKKTWKLSTEHNFREEELADLDTWNKMMMGSFQPVADSFSEKDDGVSLAFISPDDDSEEDYDDE